MQVAVILAGFFALGMVPTDTLDNLLLREVFAKIMGTVGFKAISYGLSIVALSIAAAESYPVISGVDFLPAWAGAFLAVLILAAGLVYAYRKHVSETITDQTRSEPDCILQDWRS